MQLPTPGIRLLIFGNAGEVSKLFCNDSLNTMLHLSKIYRRWLYRVTTSSFTLTPWFMSTMVFLSLQSTNLFTDSCYRPTSISGYGRWKRSPNTWHSVCLALTGGQRVEQLLKLYGRKLLVHGHTPSQSHVALTQFRSPAPESTRMDVA